MCEGCCSPKWWATVLPHTPGSDYWTAALLWEKAGWQVVVVWGVLFACMVSSSLGFTFTLNTALRVHPCGEFHLSVHLHTQNSTAGYPCGEFHPRVHLDTQNSTASSPLWWGVSFAPSNSCCLPLQQDGRHANNYPFQGVHVAYLLLPKTRAP